MPRAWNESPWRRTHQPIPRLSGYDTNFRSFLRGDTTVEVVPGLVEQLLDEVLDDVLEHGDGTLRLTFTGLEHAIRIDVEAVGPDLHAHSRLEHARVLAEAMGGTMSGEVFSASGLSLLLPGR